jgi:hypothetical protein
MFKDLCSIMKKNIRLSIHINVKFQYTSKDAIEKELPSLLGRT